MSLRIVSCLGIGFAISVTAFAHHASDPHFDHGSPMSVGGVVTDLQFVNPHAYVYFNVTSVRGEIVPWRCELSAATLLVRRGWTRDTVRAGQDIVVHGSPARREEHVCFLNSFELDGGPEIARGENLNGVATIASVAEMSGERPERLLNGQPNLTGSWVSLSFGAVLNDEVDQNEVRGFRDSYEPTRAGLEARVGYDMAFDNPKLRCHVGNVIDGWNTDRHVNEVYQNDDEVILQYGFMDFVRVVYLDMEVHPADITPSTGGHSIGWWEGETLVVDTVGFEQGILLPRDGTSHSDQMHLVERFSFDAEESVLFRNYRIEDPRFLVSPVDGQDVMGFSVAPYEPYGCLELSGDNNIRR